MTDGPYAPPSMSRQWNEFGRALLRTAFEEEAAPCLRHALLTDARREQVGELTTFLKETLCTNEPDLFGDAQKAALAAARDRFPAPMAQSALDHCEGALRDGHDPNAAINEGVAACMKERARDSSNSIEAHQMSQEGTAKAGEAQSRFETLLPQTDWKALADEFHNGPQREQEASDSERDRLDDGPPKGSS